MKKYDKSEIMKRAHRFYKGKEYRTFSECLKASWAIAKRGMEVKEEVEVILDSSFGSLPELDGSPKQIAWAEDIRDGYMKRLDAYIKDLGKSDGYERFVRQESRRQMECLIDATHETQTEVFGLICCTYTYTESAREKMEQESKNFDEDYNKFLVDEYKKVVETQASAKFWIEHR